MTRKGRVLAAAAAVATAGAAAAYHSYRRGMDQAEEGWRAIAARPRPPAPAFESAMVASLPEVAQRYFLHAMAPGTPLRQTVELEMRGAFLLGDKGKFQSFEMTARQILAPPTDFVWLPRMRAGVMRISGADALVAGAATTRFWLNGLVPVANEPSSPDLVRSATFRSAIEAIWVPASLMPVNGIVWEQIGADTARVTINRVSPPVTIELTLNADGSVREVIGQRWSNANPDKTFRLQPFGGTVAAERTFQGFTVPSRLSVGNHFRTDDYLPFFQAEIVNAVYR